MESQEEKTFIDLGKKLVINPQIKDYFNLFCRDIINNISFDMACIIISEDGWKRTFKEYISYTHTSWGAQGPMGPIKGSIDGTSLLIIVKTSKSMVYNRLIESPFYDLQYLSARGFNSSLQMPLVFTNELAGILQFSGVGENQFKKIDNSIISNYLPYITISLLNTLTKEQLDEANKELVRCSITDQVTQVFNYRYFLKRIREEFHRIKRYGGVLACLIIRIDHFREINHRYGYLFGDFILKRFASILRRNLRRVDIIARYGWNEFIILMPNTDEESTYLVVEKIRNILMDFDFIRGKKSTRIKIKIGMSTFPCDGINNVRDVIRAANNDIMNVKDEEEIWL